MLPMSEKNKNENTLIKLKLIHAVLALIILVLGIGYKYWPQAPDPEPTSQQSKPKEKDSQKIIIGDNKGNLLIGDNTTVHDNRVVNNYDLNPKGGENTKRSPTSFSTPTKKKITTNYFNKKYSGDIAVIGLENKNGFSNELKALLSKGNFKTTTSFFRSSFLQDYKTDIWDQGSDILESFKIQNKINCTCLVKEQIKYREMDRSGGNMIAEGNIDLQLINLNSGESTTISIPIGGSGFDKAEAYKNMQTNFSKELTLQNQLSKFELCKK
jgi:hypothetical protein